MGKNMLRAMAAAAGMLILILDSGAALRGAREGIDLCIRTLIPSLLPFFILSSQFTGNLIGRPIRSLQPICRLCGVPKGAESLLAVGFLGGYPVGAQNIARAYKAEGISKSDAELLLGFCNNGGPAFIFGILGSMFSRPFIPWVLWGIHIVSGLIVGMILPKNKESTASIPSNSVSLSDSLESSLRVMAVVCGWVVIFRMILTFLERWILWYFPYEWQVAAAGLLELSNGCILLGEIPSEMLRFLLGGLFLSAGGFCVIMQIISVAKGLSLKLFFFGKILQCGLCFVLSILFYSLFDREEIGNPWAALMIFIILMGSVLIYLLHKMKKRSSIPAAVGV